ncbi:hypothetical protein CBOM_05965 [Ceraceosorus bombacis]|uniref:Uncharacterized protein n=1 Tax=Ceraceosorus bombacis TaxID=401625 RepID=A0A0P1BIZ6_9BASI|nr:hypothetical protein CBOM_05965 [Ceraceosorus bombacis]
MSLLPLVSHADGCASSFQTHLRESFPAISALYTQDARVAEAALDSFRETLAKLQKDVDDLAELVYRVDAWTSEARGMSVGQDPQQALQHVGGLVDIEAGKKQTMDDLADMLASFG